MHGSGRGGARRTGRCSTVRCSAFGPGEMWRRWEQARQLIRQHGVTFNVYGDARGLERPWPLDPVPVVLAPDEFAAWRLGWRSARRCSTGCWPISTARDGCSAKGWCPPEMLLAHPGLLRAVRRDIAARRPLPALLRRRSGAHARGRAARAGRPDAGAGRRGLRAREPHRARPRAARGVPRVPGAAAGAVLPHAARHAGRAGAARAREPAHRAAHRRAATTRPTSSRRSWRSTSATRWSRGAI